MGGTAGQPSYSDLAALVAQLQVELPELRADIQQPKKRIAELEKKNPTQRLDKSYSLKADEKRRKEAETKKSGKPKTHGSSGDQQAPDLPACYPGPNLDLRFTSRSPLWSR